MDIYILSGGKDKDLVVSLIASLAYHKQKDAIVFGFFQVAVKLLLILLLPSVTQFLFSLAIFSSQYRIWGSFFNTAAGVIFAASSLL